MKYRAGLQLRRLFGLRQFVCDLGDQTRILLQAEQEVHAVRLAPSHQFLPRKPAVSTDENAHLRPAAANLRDDPCHLLRRPRRRVHARRPQLGRQQVPAAEHVERQVAVAVVITVEEASLLLPVHRIVGRIQIEDDLARRTLVRVQEQIDQQPLDGDRIVTDLVIARRLQPAQFQPVQRRLAGNRRAVLAAGCQLARQHRHHRVVAQLVVVIEVLIAKRDPEHPLRQQGHDLMLDQMLSACVVEARGKPLRQLDRAIRRPKKQRPGIRRNRPAVERAHNFASFNRCKSEQIRATLCPHRGAPRIDRKTLLHNYFR